MQAIGGIRCNDLRIDESESILFKFSENCDVGFKFYDYLTIFLSKITGFIILSPIS